MLWWWFIYLNIWFGWRLDWPKDGCWDCWIFKKIQHVDKEVTLRWLRLFSILWHSPLLKIIINLWWIKTHYYYYFGEWIYMSSDIGCEDNIDNMLRVSLHVCCNVMQMTIFIEINSLNYMIVLVIPLCWPLFMIMWSIFICFSLMSSFVK